MALISNGNGGIMHSSQLDLDQPPPDDTVSITLHAGERGDWPIPWAGLTVPRGKSLRLVRDAYGRWVEVRDGVA